MTIAELYEKLAESFPQTLSAPWDNDGIMVSRNTDAPVKRVLVSLDATDGAIRYAYEHGYDTLLTHHPMIFRGQKAVVPDSFCGKRILDAALHGVSVLSFHTRADAGQGGVNDALLEKLGFTSVGSFGDDETPTLARMAEIPPMTARQLGHYIKEKLDCGAVRMTGDGERMIRKLAVCGGAGGDFLTVAAKLGCDAFLTGECGYNCAEDIAEESGLVTYEVGHYHSEAPVTEAFLRLLKTFDGIESCDFYNSCPYEIL